MQKGKNTPFYITDFKLEHILKFIFKNYYLLVELVNIYSLRKKVQLMFSQPSGVTEVWWFTTKLLKFLLSIYF